MTDTDMTVRDACRRRQPLGPADAQALEHALTQVERERDEALGRVNRARAAASSLIGAERGLCRSCGRAHAIQHEYDCPVPALLRALHWESEGSDDG